MISPAKVVVAARRWLDTPWHHQARVLGVGVDCAGLIVMVGRELGAFDAAFDYTRYGRSPTGALEIILDRHMVRLPTLQLGALVAVTWWERAQHLGIVGEHLGRQTLIHAYLRNRKVVEQGIDEHWRNQVVGIYGFPGVQYEGVA